MKKVNNFNLKNMVSNPELTQTQPSLTERLNRIQPTETNEVVPFAPCNQQYYLPLIDYLFSHENAS